MKGQTGGSLGGFVERAPRCKHSWSKWERAAVFDSRLRRTCAKCGWLQLRKPSKTNPKTERPARRRRLTPTESAVVEVFAPDSESVAAFKAKLRASIKEAKKARL